MRRTKPLLARWRSAVGPPVIQGGENQSDPPADELTVVTWNTAVGAGDLSPVRRRAAAISALRAAASGGLPRWRRTSRAPCRRAPCLRAAAWRRVRATAATNRSNRSPVRSACRCSTFRRCGMGVRNRKRTAGMQSSRACLCAISPPTSCRSSGSGGSRSPPRSTAPPRRHPLAPSPRQCASRQHLQPAAPAGWLGYGRTRQARSLVASLDTGEPLILGGDFNTWSGFSDQAYLTLAHRFPGRSPDRSPADVPWSAEARPPVLQARARLECHVSPRGGSVPLGSLPADRHRALPTYRFCRFSPRFYPVLRGSGSENPVEPRRTP